MNPFQIQKNQHIWSTSKILGKLFQFYYYYYKPTQSLDSTIERPKYVWEFPQFYSSTGNLETDRI